MPIIHLTLFGKRVGQLIVLEGSLVVRMHSPARRCQNYGSVAIPSTFNIYIFSAGVPLPLSELQVALSDAGAPFLSGDVIKVGGRDPNQFRRKDEPLDMEALLSSKLLEFCGISL